MSAHAHALVVDGVYGNGNSSTPISILEVQRTEWKHNNPSNLCSGGWGVRDHKKNQMTGTCTVHAPPPREQKARKYAAMYGKFAIGPPLAMMTASMLPSSHTTL